MSSRRSARDRAFARRCAAIDSRADEAVSARVSAALRRRDARVSARTLRRSTKRGRIAGPRMAARAWRRHDDARRRVGARATGWRNRLRIEPSTARHGRAHVFHWPRDRADRSLASPKRRLQRRYRRHAGAGDRRDDGDLQCGAYRVAGAARSRPSRSHCDPGVEAVDCAVTRGRSRTRTSSTGATTMCSTPSRRSRASTWT